MSLVAVKEVTVWNMDVQPNHVYLLDGDKIVAYQKWGEGEPIYRKHQARIDKRGRKFIALKDHPFKIDVKTESTLIEVKGSKGDSYFVDKDKKTCTCPGYTFRHTCKHLNSVLES